MVERRLELPAPRRSVASFGISLVVVPTALACIVWFRREGFLAATPLWFIVALVVISVTGTTATAVALRSRPGHTSLAHVKVAWMVLTTAAVLYSAGWGSLLLVAYLLSGFELIDAVGSRFVRPMLGWVVAAVVTGELAVQLGWAPSVVSPGLSHAVAAIGTLCLLMGLALFGRTAAAADDAERRWRERGRHFEALVAHAADVIGTVDPVGTIRSVSPGVESMLGVDADALVGTPLADLVDPDGRDVVDGLLASARGRAGRPNEAELEMRHANGSVRSVVATLTAPAGEPDAWIAINLHDITTQRQLERRLRHDARHDSLTGLFNREAFAAAMDDAAAASEDGSHVGLLFIDLDGFKAINDEFGHSAGDQVLVTMAQRIAGALRSEEVLARLGGDEFAVLVHPVCSPDELDAVAERIRVAAAQPLPLVGEGVRVGASVGAAFRSDMATTMEELLNAADSAMYEAKRSARGVACVSPDPAPSGTSRPR